MVLFNYATKELTAKVVYYGPGLCGKTTNLQYIHQNLPETVKGKMLSLATKTDRTLFFDFLPLDLGDIRGMKTRVQLYTVPGQVFYNETRKLVLKGVDGVVFVADSQKEMLGPNAESFKNLEENLKGHGLTLAEMPHVIQFNKRDLPKLSVLRVRGHDGNRRQGQLERDHQARPAQPDSKVQQPQRERGHATHSTGARARRSPRSMRSRSGPRTSCPTSHPHRHSGRTNSKTWSTRSRQPRLRCPSRRLRSAATRS